MKLNEVKQSIARTRKNLEDLWESKQETDHEVLKVALELDDLLNEYERLLKEASLDEIVSK